MKRAAAAAAVAGVLALAAAPASAAAPKPSTPTTVKPSTSRVAPARATTQRKQEIDNRIGSLRAQVAEASAEEHELLGRLDDSGDRLAALSAKVSTLDAQIRSAQGQLGDAQSELDDLEARFLRARSQLDVARHELGAAKREMRNRAIAAYTGGPSLGHYTAMVVDVRNPEELAVRSGYMRSLLEQQNAAVDRFKARRDDIAQLRSSLESARHSALQQRNVVVTRKQSLESARREQQTVRQQAAAEHARREGLLAEIRRRKAEFQAEIANLKAESESIAALLRARQAAQTAAPAGRGILGYPVPGAITSNFGPRLHPIFRETRQHAGVDFHAPSGAPIRAAAGGVVVFAGSRGGYGNTTVIDHGGSLATLYAHQSRFAVQAGEAVAKGQLIGYVGSTGFSTGPHLHFEVRLGGTPVNPISYL